MSAAAGAGVGAGAGSGSGGSTGASTALLGPRKYPGLAPYTTKGGAVVPNIFIKEDTIVFFGTTIATRMTVVVLTGDSAGKLFIHSPTPLDDALTAALAELGEVAYVISPNKIHNMAMPGWQKAYPAARLYASPGLVERRPDIKFYATLTNAPEPEWKQDLDQALFYHKATRTLIVCDMVENTGDESMGCCMGCLLRCCLVSIMGSFRNFASPEHRWYTEDAAAVAQTRRRVMAWEFNKLIMSHGTIVEEYAQEVVEEVFDTWIREARGCTCSHCCRCCCRMCAAYQ